MKINILLALIFITFITYANIDYLHGIVGMTLRDGGIGCVCHGIEATDTVNVWIEGPDSVLINQTIEYKLFMSGGPAAAGGFNIASYFGELHSVDTLTQIMFGELTHSSPNTFVNDTVAWNFSYTAPDSITIDTLYSVGNSVNGNGNPSQDQWNFGENFVIHIIDNPVYVQNTNLNPDGFELQQNYPNPFNPSTNIRFSLSDFGFVSLKVYDVVGKEITTLVNEEKAAGNYNVNFDASILTSGVYFYRLESKEFAQAMKMILMK